MTIDTTPPQPEAPPAIMEQTVKEGSPPIKRDLEENRNDSPAQERSHKRQRTNTGEEPQKKKKHKSKANKQNGESAAKDEGLADLKKGLLYITDSAATSGFSDTIFNTAKELYNTLFEKPSNAEVSAPASPPPSSSQAPEEETSKSKHTDLPPPFALPDPANFLKGPSPALVRLNHIAPSTTTFAPVPPIVNYSSTTSLHQPESTQLPALPDITDVLLSMAPFTHTSVLAQYVTPTNNNTYEPLEFLGDSYLEVIATRLIHSRFPNHSVGQKAGLRELLVKNETLAEYSTAYGFSDRIRTAVVSRTGPTWMKILADVFEAYLAAVVIQDGTEKGFMTAERWLTELWAPKIVQWQRRGDGQRDMAGSATQKLDAKSDLNRLLGGKESKIEYKETKEMELLKEGNRTVFYIGAYFTGFGWNNFLLGSGEGRSKQIASTVAATNALRESADVIRLASAKKMEHERQFKKQTGFRKSNQGFHGNPHPKHSGGYGGRGGHGGYGGRPQGAPY